MRNKNRGRSEDRPLCFCHLRQRQLFRYIVSSLIFWTSRSYAIVELGEVGPVFGGPRFFNVLEYPFVPREVEEANHLVVLESLEVVEHFLCVSVSTSQAPVLIAHDLRPTHAHWLVCIPVSGSATSECQSLILKRLVAYIPIWMQERPIRWPRAGYRTADVVVFVATPAVSSIVELKVFVELGLVTRSPQIPQHVVLEPDGNSPIRPVASSEEASLNIPDCQRNLYLEVVRIAPSFELPTNLVVRVGNAFLLWSEPLNTSGNIGRKICVHSPSVAVGTKTFRSCRDEPMLEILPRSVVRAVWSTHRRTEPAGASPDAFIQQVDRSCWFLALPLRVSCFHEPEEPQHTDKEVAVSLLG